MMKRGNLTGFKKGAARLSVEDALKHARTALSSQDIAQITGVAILTVRTHLGNCVTQGLAYNIGTRGKGLYLWGQPERATPVNVAQPRSRISDATYTGPQWAIREGGLDHLSHPSRRGDERVSHAPMMLMGGSLG